MKIVQHSQIAEPLETPTGEQIFELIGKTMGDQPNHSLAYIVIPPGKSSAPHFHQVSHESYYILKGEGEMRVDQQDFVLKPGQVCYIEPGETHQISNQGETDLIFLAVCVPAWVPEDSFED